MFNYFVITFINCSCRFDVSEHPVGTKLTPTMQAVQSEGQSARYKEFGPNEEIEYSGYTNPHVQSRSFRLLQDDLSRVEIESRSNVQIIH